VIKISYNLLIVSKFYILNLLQDKILLKTNYLIQILAVRNLIKLQNKMQFTDKKQIKGLRKLLKNFK